jgi:hypothetical protein
MLSLVAQEMQSRRMAGAYENNLARPVGAPKNVEYASSHWCCGCGSHGIVCLDRGEDEAG